MSNISNIVVGATPSTANATYWSNGNIPWLPSGCCQDGEVVESYHAMKMISQKGYDSCSTTMMDPGTVLIALTGATAGKVGLLKFRACANQSVVGISTFLELEPKFVFYQLMGRRQEILSDCIGSAQPHISKEYITKMYFALPPYAEQKRIINEIEKIEPLITEYNKLEKQKTKLDSEIYGNLKKSILQYAIQGKLVPQDSNDEPASVLLEKIRAEKKAKLGKKYVESYIYKGDDNCYYEKVGKTEPVLVEDLPFDIPDSWSWARLNNITEFENGDRSQKYPVESDYVAYGIPFWGAKDIINNELTVTNNLRYISKEKFNELNNGKLQDKDFICLLRGAVGKWAIFNATNQILTGFINAQMVIIRANRINIVDWLKLYFSSPFFASLSEKYKNGTAVTQISAKDLSHFLVPIPPQTEQIRISEKIKEIFKEIDKGED